MAAEVWSREGLQHLTRLIVALVKPVYDARAEHARHLRNTQAVHDWFLKADQGHNWKVLAQ
eukprot:8936496-Lingulodinium_polyedra.AAC.1